MKPSKKTNRKKSKEPSATLRDYFAGSALLGLSILHPTTGCEDIVNLAFHYADLMMKRRLKK